MADILKGLFVKRKETKEPLIYNPDKDYGLYLDNFTPQVIERVAQVYLDTIPGAKKEKVESWKNGFLMLFDVYKAELAKGEIHSPRLGSEFNPGNSKLLLGNINRWGSKTTIGFRFSPNFSYEDTTGGKKLKERADRVESVFKENVARALIEMGIAVELENK